MQGVEVEGVAFAHDETPVLHKVSLSMPAGSLTVLAGPSGSGKTTIIDLILGLYRPDKGEMSVDGVPLDASRSAALARRRSATCRRSFCSSTTR